MMEPTSNHAKILIDTIPRLQWKHDGGYCGETSLQSIALSHGSWLSQSAIREAGGSELLIGTESFDSALDKFSFDYESWDFEEADNPQFDDFLVWMKRHLHSGFPVVFGVFASDGINDPDYDHIVTAIGYNSRSNNPSELSADDELVYYTHFSLEPVLRTVGSLAASRAECAHTAAEGGNIPRDVCYGVAIRGLRRPAAAPSLPVRPLPMHSICFNLLARRHYLRYYYYDDDDVVVVVIIIIIIIIMAMIMIIITRTSGLGSNIKRRHRSV